MLRHLILTLLILASFGSIETAATETEQPNIVFIIVDDMGYADAGCYGSKAIKTPNIDQMATEGMRFTQAYSGCTVCAPARSTLMTGLHMGHTPVRSNRGGVPLADADVTVAEVLKQKGYVCGGFGKWGIGDINTTGAAEKQGFDTFFGYYHQIHAHNFYPEYLIEDGKHFPLSKNADLNGKKPAGPTVDSDRQFSAQLIFDRMKQFIRDNKDKPFFCYAPWTPPHAAYHLPKNDPAWDLYKDKEWKNDAKVHASFVSMTDRYLGETLALLKELDIDKKTVVFFVSDNGASKRFDGTLDSSGPLTGFKRSMFEGGIRVPMVVRWPEKIAAGSVSDLPTYFPDFMPTAADIAGATNELPANVDGISIVPELTGQGSQPKHEFMYWEWPKFDWKKQEVAANMQAVRYGDWKLLRMGMKTDWQLYDLTKDIAEKNNLAGEHPDLISKLDKWVTANRNDPAPQIEPKHPKGKQFNLP